MESRNQIWTVGKTLSWMTERFQTTSETARLDAQVLLGHATGLSRVEIYMHFEKPLTLPEREKLRLLVRRRLVGEPVAYIVGHKEWLDLDLIVDDRVLIPRPETETLFDIAARWFESAIGVNPTKNLWIVDLCTGSGCLALACAKRFPNIEIMGVDVSEDALNVAKLNSERSDLYVEWLQADVLRPDCWTLIHERMVSKSPSSVLFITNPPYVSEHEFESCEQGVREFEPKLALVAPDDGLAVVAALVRQWLRLSANHPESEFFLAMESAAGQPKAVLERNSGHQLVPENPETISARDHVNVFPVEGFFIGQDLEGKARFLFGRSSRLKV